MDSVFETLHSFLSFFFGTQWIVNDTQTCTSSINQHKTDKFIVYFCSYNNEIENLQHLLKLKPTNKCSVQGEAIC